MVKPKQQDNREVVRFIKVDITRSDETFYALHIDFFITHLQTSELLFFTSEDVQILDNFEFLRSMCIAEEEKVDKIMDEDYNDIFFLHKHPKFGGLDVCLILNGVVDVMVFRKDDVQDKVFEIEETVLYVKER